MYKVVIAGCGLIAAKKHIPAFLALKNKVEVAAVCDLNINAVKKTAASFNVRRTYADFSDMLLKEKPDIVDICTPPQTHARLGIEAIEKRAHIFLGEADGFKGLGLRCDDRGGIKIPAGRYALCIIRCLIRYSLARANIS